MSGAMKKDAKDYIPYCADQGIPNIPGTNKPGLSMQVLPEWSFPAGGVLVFEDEGLMNMANAEYGVLVQNQTSAARPATVAKTATGCTLTGPNAADVLDIVITGKLQGQLG